MSEIGNVIGWDEGMRVIDNESDPAVKQLMLIVIGSIARLHTTGVAPVQPLDLPYVLKVLRLSFEQKGTIRAILDGRDTGPLWDDRDWKTK
ncbi:hypothetical protein [Sorangium sp. So ce385]|uniref:hypothetical protein n=1 Tax=Sorangium sp. So ce385 TaxID=3133308 RepID=UPI003F5C6A11